MSTLPACRPACAACCTAPSISSPIPGTQGGKPAGVPCVQLDAAGACRLFGRPERPAVCSSLQPSLEMCGNSRAEAMWWLTRLEAATTPAAQPVAADADTGSANRGWRASHQRSKK